MKFLPEVPQQVNGNIQVPELVRVEPGFKLKQPGCGVITTIPRD